MEKPFILETNSKWIEILKFSLDESNPLFYTLPSVAVLCILNTAADRTGNDFSPESLEAGRGLQNFNRTIKIQHILM